jgi:hypothetical protein
MSKTELALDKTGVKPGKNQGQNRVQNQVRTRVKPGSTWSPHTPTVVFPSLVVGQPQSRTTTSPAEVQNVLGRLRSLISIRLVWFTASLAAPAHISASGVPVGRRFPAFPSPQSARRFSLSPSSVRLSGAMLSPALFPSAGAQQPRRRLSSWRRRGLSSPSAQTCQQDLAAGSFPKIVLPITGPDRRASPSWPKDFHHVCNR